MGRVACIVVDSAERTQLLPMLGTGRLPNLTALRDRSATFDLETPPAYRAETVWARFLSGRDPVADRNWAACNAFDPADYGLGLLPASAREPFYALGPDTEVIALDLIQNRAVDGVHGSQVVAWGSHSPMWPRTSRPAGLLAEIDATFGTNPVFNNDVFDHWFDPAYADGLAQASVEGARRRAEIARWLLERQPDWDLFLMGVSEYHSLGHHLWHGPDPSHPLHATPAGDAAARAFDAGLDGLDESLGRVLGAFDEQTTVVVCSFHGCMPSDEVAVTALLPELFQRQHLGRGNLRDPDQDAWRRAGCPPITPDAGSTQGDWFADRFGGTPRQRLRRAARQRLSPETFRKLRRLAGREVAELVISWADNTPSPVDEVSPADVGALGAEIDYQVSAWYRPWWPKLPWFALPTFGDAHIRINLAGRERDGIIAKDDYADACRRLTDDLRALRDGRTGKPVVGEVLLVRADDPFDPEGPDADVVAVFEGAPDALVHPDVGMVGPYPHLRSGAHSPRGWAMVSGPGIDPGHRGARSTDDVTPTLLALLGVDDLSRCTGEPLLVPAR